MPRLSLRKGIRGNLWIAQQLNESLDLGYCISSRVPLNNSLGTEVQRGVCRTTRYVHVLLRGQNWILSWFGLLGHDGGLQTIPH